MNEALQTLIVLPLTRSEKKWPTRVPIVLQKIQGQACIEHIRSVSKERFTKKLGVASELEMAMIRKHLQAVFAL